jgi:hypothetical protein
MDVLVLPSFVMLLDSAKMGTGASEEMACF